MAQVKSWRKALFGEINFSVPLSSEEANAYIPTQQQFPLCLLMHH